MTYANDIYGIENLHYVESVVWFPESGRVRVTLKPDWIFTLAPVRALTFESWFDASMETMMDSVKRKCLAGGE